MKIQVSTVRNPHAILAIKVSGLVYSVVTNDNAILTDGEWWRVAWDKTTLWKNSNDLGVTTKLRPDNGPLSFIEHVPEWTLIEPQTIEDLE